MRQLPERIVSGGQTGVDRAALEAAIAIGIAHGGWCPKGRRAEDGAIPSRYDLTETDSGDYSVRTEQNVIDSDATLILYENKMSGGTLLTFKITQRYSKPCLTIRIDQASKNKDAFKPVAEWLDLHSPETLNIAGPRESTFPGIQERAFDYLIQLFASSSK